MTSFVQNPLNNITEITLFDDEDEEIKIDKFNISKYFKCIYILCPLTDNLNSDIYMNQIEEGLFDNIMKTMILYKTSIRIVKNPLHFNNIIYASNEKFKSSNFYNYDLEDNILVLPILNISFLKLQKYLDNFNENYDLETLYNLIIIHNYFGEDTIFSYKNNFYLENFIKNLSESNYWSYQYNCKLNFTNLFKNRKFNVSKFNNLDADVNKLMKQLENVDTNDNYIEEIFKFKKYCDASSIVKNYKYSLFNIDNSSKFTKNDISELFKKLNSYNKFFLFCKLLVSKKYCHLVFSNELLHTDKILKKNINYYAELVQYLLGYTWLVFYMEECIKKSYLKTTDRVIFTIDVASKLPVFPLDPDNPHKNPYLPLMTSDNVLNPSKNINGVMFGSNFGNFHRIATLSEFRDRLNIFITNSKHNNIFNGIDFSKNKMAITGSVMTACMQYYHPLMKLFDTKENDTIDSKFYRYFQEYYCESDIDIMIKTTDNFEFFDIINNIYDNIKTNIKMIYDVNEPPLTKTHIKNLYVYLSPDFIKENLCESIPYELVITNLNSDKIKDILFPYISKLHQDQINQELADFNESEISILKSKYPQYFMLSVNDLNIRLSKKDSSKILSDMKFKSDLSDDNMDELINNITCKEEMELNENSIKILFNFKVKLSSPLLDHTLEIFPIRGDDFFAVVNTFHLPCVRAFYDGENVYMTPSCISAHLTYMNINYKYVAGTKDPLDIINKYRMRGFGTYLNQTEIKLYIKYISSNKFWNNLFNVSKNNVTSYKNCLGFLPLNHKLFHPRLYNAEYYEKQNIRYLGNWDDEIKHLYADPKELNIVFNPNYLANRYSSIKLDMKNFSVQNPKTGYINQIKPYIIEYVLKENNGDFNISDTYLNLPIPPSDDINDNINSDITESNTPINVNNNDDDSDVDSDDDLDEILNDVGM